MTRPTAPRVSARKVSAAISGVPRRLRRVTGPAVLGGVRGRPHHLWCRKTVWQLPCCCSPQTGLHSCCDAATHTDRAKPVQPDDVLAVLLISALHVANASALRDVAS